MKLFQQLLVAPAALGLMAPLVATAAEVNINEVVNYASQDQLVETTAQFSDVVPGDWAYTALQNLSESYGCVDNAYTQNLKSGQALTRFEAAALVNSCLEGGLVASGQGMNQDAARLTNEFGSEMAILKGRVDGLENRVTEFNAGTFSSTTLMSGTATFSTGAVDNATTGQRLHNIYAYTIDLTTSYSGEDSLDVELVAGNGAATESLGVLDSAETTGNSLDVNKLSYTFPLGDFTVTAGALMEQDDVISATLSTYSDSLFIENQPYSTGQTETGPGAGITYYSDNNWNASVSFVSADGADADNGIGTEQGDDVVTASFGYDGNNWGGGVIAAVGDENGTDSDNTEAWGLGLYWSPEGNYPTISVGWDQEENEDGTADNEAWTIGLDYEGWGPGTLSVGWQHTDDETDELTAFEVYYNWEVADGINIQPGIFTNEIADDDDETGAVVEAIFKF